MIDLLCIGEVMGEIRRDGRGFAVGYAGDTFNTAYYARKAGADLEVSYCTRIGRDPLSDGLLAWMRQNTLCARHIQQDETRNLGLYAVATDESGERSFSYWRDQSAARHMFGDSEKLPAARCIYLSGITLAILPPAARQRLMEELASSDALIAFDSNYRPSLWENVQTAREIMSAVWGMAHIALPSMDDEVALFENKTEEEVIDRFRKKQWTACAIKRGDRGPVSLTAPVVDFPAAETVIDTTAAGDSFNGGYLAAFLAGKSEAQCLQAGHELARRVVAHSGAIVPVPE
ncbi:MAG: sugar kinase [Pseudomonadota bacterium]